MENASKALIIAGAILISILLISVAIMVLGSTNGIQEQMGSQMSAQEVRTFNAQFSNYIGTRKTAAQVRQLYQVKQASNANNSYQISMVAGSAIQNDAATPATVLAANAEFTSDAVTKMSTRKRYTIKIDEDTYGVYNKITVTQE